MSSASQSVRLSSAGLSLHALERNPLASTPLLLLHGWLDHAHSFDWVCAALPATVRTLALDFRGHGRSEHARHGHYHFADYLADVRAGVQHLGGRVHLVGHSMGGAVAVTYAAADPAAVASVTTVESLGPIGSAPSEALDRMQAFVRELGRPALKRTYASVDEAVARVRSNNSGLSEAAAQLLTRFGTQPVEGGVQFTFDPRLRQRTPLTFDDAQIAALLGGIRCPVQVIHATHGFSFDDQEMKARLARLGSPVPVALEGGHHVHLDQPGPVAALLERFVNANP
jgi:pimeloyl-ACP methyl ester carboxylesterase